MDVEVPHANLKNTGKASELRSKTSHLSKVTRMVLVKVDPVVMLPTSVSTSSRMLPVLSNPGQNDRENRVIQDIRWMYPPPITCRAHETHALSTSWSSSCKWPSSSSSLTSEKRQGSCYQIHHAGSVIQQSLTSRLERFGQYYSMDGISRLVQLLEADVLGVLVEALPTQVQVVFPDQTVPVNMSIKYMFISSFEYIDMTIKIGPTHCCKPCTS